MLAGLNITEEVSVMIRSISFLSKPNERTHITASNGRFTLERKKRVGSLNNRKTFSAKDFVEFVKTRDPYITLSNGEKLRVFRGGDPSDEVIETISIVETHDEKYSVPDQLDFNAYYDW